jgi:hypothetical protein
MAILSGIGANARKADLEVAQAEAPEFERVKWWKDGNLPKLYLWCSVLLVASATTGYDGQMLNASQLMDPWQKFFGNPTGSRLGLLNFSFNIGSIVSLFIVPTFTDWYVKLRVSYVVTQADYPCRVGRKIPIAVGCLIVSPLSIASRMAQNTNKRARRWLQVALSVLSPIIGMRSFMNNLSNKLLTLHCRGTYFGGRLLLGFGNSMAQMCSPILLTEIAHPQHRAPLTAVYNCLWNVGSLFVAWWVFGQARV